jgi:uncharacterized protein YdaU (DUF1376 family)
MTRKAPAFQLYVDDFLAGTMCMTAEEVGVYIRLLCLQWSHGALSERHVRAAGGDSQAGRIVLDEKFEKTDKGYINRRLEEVRNLKDIRTKSASKGGSKTQANRQANAQAKSDQNGVAKSKSPTPTPTPTPTPSSDPNPIPDPVCVADAPTHTPQIDQEPITLSTRSQEFKTAWNSWRSLQMELNRPLTATSEEAALMELERCYPSKEAEQVAVINFSVLRRAMHLITTGEHNLPRTVKTSHQSRDLQKTKGEKSKERLFGS